MTRSLVGDPGRTMREQQRCVKGFTGNQHIHFFSAVITQTKNNESLGYGCMRGVGYSTEDSDCACSERVQLPSRQRWRRAKDDYRNGPLSTMRQLSFVGAFRALKRYKRQKARAGGGASTPNF